MSFSTPMLRVCPWARTGRPGSDAGAAPMASRERREIRTPRFLRFLSGRLRCGRALLVVGVEPRADVVRVEPIRRCLAANHSEDSDSTAATAGNIVSVRWRLALPTPFRVGVGTRQLP